MVQFGHFIEESGLFTGIVDHTGSILAVEQQPDSLRLLISCDFNDLKAGESVAVNGVCLTAVSPQRSQFSCDVSRETLRLTTLGQLDAGSVVNLERALKPTDRLGGHFVTGHVDMTLTIAALIKCEEYVELECEGVDPEHQAYLIPKGSVAVNGVSLTINALTPSGFKVMLIPHTLERTQLSELTVGALINIEYDMLAKISVRQLAVLHEKEKVGHE